MAKNDNVSDLDSPRLVKLVIDSEHDAVRVIQALNTEMYIQVSAEDNDSVQSVARSRVVSEADGVVDCSRMRKVCKFSNCDLKISADGENFITLNCDPAETVELCAMKIKVTGGSIVIRS